MAKQTREQSLQTENGILRSLARPVDLDFGRVALRSCSDVGSSNAWGRPLTSTHSVVPSPFPAIFALLVAPDDNIENDNPAPMDKPIASRTKTPAQRREVHQGSQCSTARRLDRHIQVYSMTTDSEMSTTPTIVREQFHPVVVTAALGNAGDAVATNASRSEVANRLSLQVVSTSRPPRCFRTNAGQYNKLDTHWHHIVVDALFAVALADIVAWGRPGLAARRLTLTTITTVSIVSIVRAGKLPDVLVFLPPLSCKLATLRSYTSPQQDVESPSQPDLGRRDS
ncbi:hypothetical protein C8F01DRAFT_1254114 [Mycena amicta]|nr:hypothetical protein C8F01DRAFT_1254114 [Mycena amicta]